MGRLRWRRGRIVLLFELLLAEFALVSFGLMRMR